MRRREFLATAALTAAPLSAQRMRPNILWVTNEDMGPHLGCYGDPYATSPNLDRFAQTALRYRNAWSNAPVCAPARTAIISGMYPPSTGSEHMRSITRLAPGQQMFPALLREQGYYCSNNVKEDYNLEHTGKVWDDSSKTAHWRNRAAGQPFFAVFNFTITHESQIRSRPHQLVNDPSKVRLPAYHPDTPEVRHDWAQYYDNITVMDKEVQGVLDQLKQDGLAEDTIVFYYADHGSGMPRSKRWPYNSGLQVPLMVHIPDKFRQLATPEYKPGAATDRLVSFVDLAPTVLSLAGIRKPAYHQGQAFLGQFAEPEQPHIFGFRGRMDERVDLVRSVRDKRYIYIRNYMPHRRYGEHVAYMFETPTTAKWFELHQAGKLNQTQDRFWQTKPPEELYDLENDPDEVNNLAASAEHKATLETLRKAQQDLARRIRDVGFLPEGEIHARSAGSAPYAMGHNASKYPFERVFRAAEQATGPSRATPAALAKGLQDADSAVRYWSATGLLVAGDAALPSHAGALAEALRDESYAPRIVAAEALAARGNETQRKQAIELLVDHANLDKYGVFAAVLALNALDALGPKVKPYKDKIEALPKDSAALPQRNRGYVPRLLEKVIDNCK